MKDGLIPFLKICKGCASLLHLAEFKRKDNDCNPFEKEKIYEICNVCNDLNNFTANNSLKFIFCKISKEWR